MTDRFPTTSGDTGGYAPPSFVGPTYMSEAPDSTVVDPGFGGIRTGSVLGTYRNKDMSEMFDAMLYSTIQPTATQPSVVLNSTSDDIRLVGENITFSVLITTNRGVLTRPWTSPVNVAYAGSPILISGAFGWEIEYPDNVDVSLAIVNGVVQNPAPKSFLVVEGANVTTVKSCFFGSGSVTTIVDNKGNTPVPLISPFEQSAVSNPTLDIQGTYNIFVGDMSNALVVRPGGLLPIVPTEPFTLSQDFNETDIVRHQVAVAVGMIGTGNSVMVGIWDNLNKVYFDYTSEFTETDVSLNSSGGTTGTVYPYKLFTNTGIQVNGDENGVPLYQISIVAP